MEAEDGRVGFGLGWEAFEVEAIGGFGDPIGKGFELVALEGLGLAVLLVAVGRIEFNEYAVFLGVGDAEPFVRQRCDERRFC